MDFDLNSVLAINKKTVAVIDKMKELIDKDFPPAPRPVMQKYGDDYTNVYTFVLNEEKITCPVDFVETDIKTLGRAYSFIVAILEYGQELLADYKARLQVIESSIQSFEGEATAEAVKDLSRTNSKGVTKSPTATEIKAAVAANSTIQLYSYTEAFYKVAIRYIEARLTAYDKLMAGISREYKRIELDKKNVQELYK